MTFIKAATVSLSLVLASATLAPSLHADDRNKNTTITFSQPVEIPGVHLKGWGVLPAGTYVFKLMDSSSNRHIVQIFNKDQTKVYATILAIPNYRLKTTNKTVLTFNEGLNGRPEAIRAWFYPGANWGEEFVYPKAKATTLAKGTSTPVLAVVTDLNVESDNPEDPQVFVEFKKAPLVGVRPTGEEVAIAQVIQVEPSPVAAPRQVAAQAAREPVQVAVTRLPDTASSMPLIALLGMLSLGGGLALRGIRLRLAVKE
ncbi:MAG: hypothetical protein ABI824_20140 [Acidobacteriota bacterium]